MFAEKLKNHIADSYLDGEHSMLSYDTELLALNIIESASIFDLVDFIKEETGVRISMTDIFPLNFSTINNIVALVKKLQTKGVES